MRLPFFCSRIGLLLLLTAILQAEPVTLEQARTAAESRLRIEEVRRAALPRGSAGPPVQTCIVNSWELKDDAGSVLAYVFNQLPDGFIVVAADSDITPVVAHSFGQTFPEADGADSELACLLRADLIARLACRVQTDPAVLHRNRSDWKGYLEALPEVREPILRLTQWPGTAEVLGGLTSSADTGWMDTTWYQTGIYNSSCPIDPETWSRCVVGCVATAMAQVAVYWEHPQTITFSSADSFISAYDPGDGFGPRSIHIDEDSAVLDFPDLTTLSGRLNSIDYSTLGSQTAADISFACGIAVEMMYSSSGSGAYASDVPYAMEGVLGFASSEMVYYDEPADSFFLAMQTNIKNGRPLLMSIRGAAGGHMVVVDGYRDTDEYHINFGWGSSAPTLISSTWYSLPDGMPSGFDQVYGVVTAIPETNPPVDLEIVCSSTIFGAEDIMLFAVDSGVGLWKMNLSVDGELLESAVGRTSPATVTWDTVLETDGTHLLMLEAFDRAGNRAVAYATVISDNDSLPNAWELAQFGDLSQRDSDDPDGDGLSNLEEYLAGTDPKAADTDGDGADDYSETVTYGTDPLDADSDDDGIPDGWEIAHGLDPLNGSDTGDDDDSDGLSNAQEYAYGTDPQNADTDGDTLNDNDEIAVYGTDPADEDSDNDGLDDAAELNQHMTDPLDPDSDDDGMRDGWEVQYSLDPMDASDSSGDPDGDTLTNLQESALHTNPNNRDTDYDGMNDAWEATYNTGSGWDPAGSDIGNGAYAPLCDYDFDGITNLDESRNGTNPLIPEPSKEKGGGGCGQGGGWGLGLLVIFLAGCRGKRL